MGSALRLWLWGRFYTGCLKCARLFIGLSAYLFLILAWEPWSVRRERGVV
ncbi:uncharacterized protein CCOS01_09660 [Colletotrichum costaricense]|uniref:Uncharacterized protein n=1 Tax=Colletotrichum costaricense TaxID=1209916 RepID=A0AAJ0DXU5_9PEZI|nr:uncharacterized protein CCOS01_09660 [Colletotrichum costaricense]KAK1521948.1 hypothetical protein CCOS01_09660 [Colletotrichum costaricense]